MDSLNDQNDEALLILLRNRDKHAFAEIYERYWPILYKHAYRLLKNEIECEDVIQDTFVNLWKIAPSLPNQTGLAAYLYTSIRNRILNIFSHSNVQAAYIDSLDDFLQTGYEITDHRVRERILAKLFEEEIANLPARMREVFELRRKQNLSYKEIAAAMDISELTVKTQMNKAITVLRKV
jgi:RNA polymerase sigma-70 factor (ECF subfamily)